MLRIRARRSAARSCQLRPRASRNTPPMPSFASSSCTASSTIVRAAHGTTPHMKYCTFSHKKIIVDCGVAKWCWWRRLQIERPDFTFSLSGTDFERGTLGTRSTHATMNMGRRDERGRGEEWSGRHSGSRRLCGEGYAVMLIKETNGELS